MFGAQSIWYQGVIYKKDVGAQRLRLLVKVDSISADQIKWKAASGNLQLSLAVDSRTFLLDYGQAIRFKSQLREVPPSLNPKAFDYRNYLRQQNVYYQTFVDEEDWEIINHHAGNPILMLADKWRKRSIKVLRKHLPSSNELGVGLALILGNKSEIDDSLRAAYANTGAMHVLAVSGLHIGMVYLGISFLLGLISWRHPYWKWTKVVFTILGVWSFALITGASPSVLRAATMFTFLIIGIAFSRYTNIYNTLAASAFILLSFNPLLLQQVGFQLSYLAVFGIIYFQPRIYRLWYIKNRYGNYLWKLVSVSLAAQITTFPLSLFYFHQFPLYFWLSGLVVVPAAVLILTGGLGLLFLSNIPGIGWLLGKTLYAVIWLTNALIFVIQQLPAGLLKGIWISGVSLFLLYLLIVLAIGFLEKRTARWAQAVLLCLCGVLVIHNLKSWQNTTQQELTVYQVYKHTLIDLIHGRQIYSLADAGLQPEAQIFPAGNYRMYKGMKEQTNFSLEDAAFKHKNWQLHRHFLQFESLRLVLINGALVLPKNPLTVDYVLLRDNPDHTIEELTQSFRFKALIFDGSNYRDRVNEWTTECEMLGLKYYSLPETGALTIELPHSPTIE
ncbi:MAG: competence protein ComEC [Saprospiraceae bacterium]|nr:MAG: competence protein ComEC [Saprospiraceae bacterium]